MSKDIARYRQQGQFDEAIELLISCCSRAAHDPHLGIGLLRKYVLQRCLVLDWAAQLFAEGKRSQCQLTLHDLKKHVLPLMQPGQYELFEARLKLIGACVTNQGQATTNLNAAIDMHIAAVDRAWNYKPTAYTSKLHNSEFAATPNDTRNGPSFLWDLDEKHRTLFQQIAGTRSSTGWLHPGLLLAGETLAVLEGKARPRDHHVETWCMFAFEDAQKCFGLLIRLVVERIPDGKGFLIPDAYHQGYTLMLDSFAQALQNAWYAARISLPTSPQCDFRWRLEVEKEFLRTPLANSPSIAISGRSAEGAITCALRAARQGLTLDRNTSMSAQLDLPIEPSLALHPVEKLDVKCLNPNQLINGNFFRKRTTAKQISDVIISDEQEDYDTGSRHEFHKVRSIYKAEEHFQKWPALTRKIKKYLARRATGDRERLCGVEETSQELRQQLGLCYVQSPVAYLLERQHPGQENEILLDETALKRFVLGRWRPKDVKRGAPIRIQLFADSGMGKSVQLVVCEERIAKSPGSAVPIRIGRSSNHRANVQMQASVEKIPWHGDLNDVFRALARNCFFIDDDNLDDTIRWMKRQARNGDLVFLIDALDQTSGDLEMLRKFLKQKEMARCPVVAAGRRETVQTRQELFAEQNWWTLELKRLGTTEQSRLLGRKLGPKLMLGEDERELDYQSSAETVRKHGWQDLLEVPLLLQLMKSLATSQHSQCLFSGEQTWNRHRLYSMAVDELMAKGEQTLAQAHALSMGLKPRKLRAWLRSAAFAMVSRHKFDVFEGDDFLAWHEQHLRDDQLDELVQQNVVTMRGYLERFLDRYEVASIKDPVKRAEPGLEWRHRCLLEYFAGCELAARWQGKDNQEIRQLLKDVHACLDDRGQIRVWPVWDAASKQNKLVFRNLSEDWQWTIRFMLCELTGDARDQMALLLLELGNPWIVVDSMDYDRLEYSADLSNVCRWLVHEQWSYKKNYTDSLGALSLEAAGAAWNSLQNANPSMQDNLLEPATRDASYLHALRQLAPSLNNSHRWPGCTHSGKAALDEYCHDDRWYPIPGFDGIQISDFPVTNAVFEAFCASHRRWRDSVSIQPDQPAVYVSWYMANEFCEWLSCFDNRHRYFLPTEVQWEAACRWNTNPEWDYWWGPEMRDDLCWYGAFSTGPARNQNCTRSRGDAIRAYGQANSFHPSEEVWRPGLLDMSGNVWEWCTDRYASDGSSRLLRGGSWGNDAVGCGSAHFGASDPGFRRNFNGFRLCRE